MLACLAEKAAARPTALQVLHQLRAAVEGGAPEDGRGAEGCAAGPGEAIAAAQPAPTPELAADGTSVANGAGEAARPQGSPASAAPLRAMSIQVPPAPPSPFAS